MLGELALIIGNPDVAVAHFEEALAFCGKVRYLPELAWTCYTYARALLEGSSTSPALREGGEREKAMSLLDEALDIAGDLGMPPLLERATILQEKAQLIPVESPLYPDGLTQREVEVLRLIARGRTNREISEELVIALNTVQRHVNNIFNKIGASNRADSAVYAVRHGLDS